MRQHTQSKPQHAEFRQSFSGSGLHERWDKLHHGDQEPFPDAPRLARLARKHPPFAAWVDAHGGAKAIAEGVQDAWRDFHSGHFTRAIEAGQKLGALGATAANKAAAIYSLLDKQNEAQLLKMLEAATARGERAVELLPEDANAHYMLALVLGRYSQRISIMRALASGLATRVRTHLDATVKLEPRHGEAHIALGLYHAEIVAKIGQLLAGLTYQASREAALEHFQRAIKLLPKSPIAHIEYANGLLLLDPSANRERARQLLELAAGIQPADAMEQHDVERAQRGLNP
jgi:tetratricopeptide (TPR) repeat protein